MPIAVTSITFDIAEKEENEASLISAHKTLVVALKQNESGFVSGELYKLAEYDGAYFHIWKWQSEEVAQNEPALRVSMPEMKEYFSNIEGEPLYTEGTLID